MNTASEAASSGNATVTQPLRAIRAMAHVADVQRSIEFYRNLGFVVQNSFAPQGKLTWAWLQNGSADFMIALSARPMNPDAQDVLFYLYSPDVDGYRKALAARGIKVSEMKYPFYAPKGEFRVDDPDGYCLMITHT